MKKIIIGLVVALYLSVGVSSDAHATHFICSHEAGNPNQDWYTHFKDDDMESAENAIVACSNNGGDPHWVIEDEE